MTTPRNGQSIVIWGAGGHAKVVADAARASGWEVAYFLDDDAVRQGENFAGATIHGPSTQLFTADADRTRILFVAIGGNAARARCLTEAQRAGYPIASLIHPSAIVSPSAQIGCGSVIMAGAVVQADARIGEGVIINTGASVDHDCVVGDFVHLAPGARLTGEVTVGDQTLVGAGAVVIPGIRIGRRAIIGAGAVVISDVPDGQTVVGVPARVVS